jgi:putative ABC transport system substrate-binding protein
VRDTSEMETVVAAHGRTPATGLIVFPEPFKSIHYKRIAALAVQHNLPAVYPYRFFAMDGGLLAYGADSVSLYRQAAGYVDRILKGENPADLPVQLPTKFELVINLKTAGALRITVPPALLARADEVIE